MRRHKHSLSNYRLATFNMGKLVPVGNFEVLPGDSIRMSTSALLRVSPLATPVMHPVQVRIHHWFVPHRILWPEWEDFITGGPDGDWSGVFPTHPVSSAIKGIGTTGNYLGIPSTATDGQLVSMLPFLAYNTIWNENYRDQDLQTEVDPAVHTAMHNCCWEKDAFTIARPWTQKGPEISFPLAGNAPVRTSATELVTGVQEPMRAKYISGATPGVNNALTMAAGSTIVREGGATGLTAGGSGVYPSNLYADMGSVSPPSVNDFRLAFALQRYAEARAQYGSRFVEYLRYLGIRSSDARLQRPEYLGGGRATISFSEVLKTGEGDTPSDDSPIGEMKGHGISAMRTRRFVRFFEEHGIVMTLASVRPRTIYQDGLHRSWTKFTKESYWQRELENIGQQEVQNREVYAAHADLAGVFGFQDRYSEYRHLPSMVTGEFQSILADWHMARVFASAPALNSNFVECTPTDRIYASTTTHQLLGMFSHSIQARRLVGNRVIGRIF